MTTTRKKLVIRADGDTSMGTGHIMRCIALAQAWQDQGGDVTFLSHCDSKTLRKRIIDEGLDFIPIDKPHPDPSDLNQTLNVLKRHAPYPIPYAPWLVLDGYHFTPDYQKAIRKTGYKLLVIDDMAHLDHYHVDLLVNQNIHASRLQYSCDRDTVKLFGCEYVLLRREFLKYKGWKREIPNKAKNILVTMGGADSDNVTLKVINAFNILNEPDIEVKIVVGPSNPYLPELRDAVRHAPCPMGCVENATNMSELMAWADVAVSAGGSTCWELAFMGVPSITVVTAGNQQDVVNGLDRAKIFKTLGWCKTMNNDVFATELINLMQDKKLREEKSRLGRELIDGDGGKNVALALAEQCTLNHFFKVKKGEHFNCKNTLKYFED